MIDQETLKLRSLPSAIIPASRRLLSISISKSRLQTISESKVLVISAIVLIEVEKLCGTILLQGMTSTDDDVKTAYRNRPPLSHIQHIYYPILYCTILYYTVLYCTILYSLSPDQLGRL